MSKPDLHKALAGVLLGTAVGDALGLPAENLSTLEGRLANAFFVRSRNDQR